MRILVLGASGMLGHKIMLKLSRTHEVTGTLRKPNDALATLLSATTAQLETGVDVFDLGTVRNVIDKHKPDAVINCIGIVKQLKEAYDPIFSITINSLFPHQLEKLAGEFNFKLIHFSTDCVFSGAQGPYTEDDLSDVHDLYGQTKHLGEVKGANALTLRTSIIGREINAPYTGLIEWFLAQSGQINGFTHALYTGLTTNAMADVVAEILTRHTNLSGLYHVSADEISKYELLKIAQEEYRTAVKINGDNNFKCDRRLDSTNFRQKAGWTPKSWPKMIHEMNVEDSTLYKIESNA